MADDFLKDASIALFDNSPAGLIMHGMEKAGGLVEDGYNAGKRAVTRLMAAKTPKSRKRTTDIVLPAPKRRSGGRRSAR